MNAQHWMHRRERGSRPMLRLMLWITLHLGWSVSRALLYAIVAYFLLTDQEGRDASREFLGRALRRKATLPDVARHLFVFASVILESVFLLSGRLERFRIDIDGLEHLKATLAAGRGCVLLGAHFGSFEALRAVARHSPVPVRPVMFRRPSGTVTSLVEALDPSLVTRVIELGAPEAMLHVREAVQRGEIVALLADRTVGEQKRVWSDFLGAPAAFAAGPLILAARLEAPVMLFYGIRTGPRRYTVQFEPFADRILLSRSDRMADLQPLVERYAASLEARCRIHPYNWFNFYRFWDTRAPQASR